MSADRSGQSDENAALDPAQLEGFEVHEGIRVAGIGEDGDVLLLGHHDPDATWAAFAGWQVSMGGWTAPDDEPREHYSVRRGHAAFSRHTDACDEQAKEVCSPCQASDHDSCSGICLCDQEYDHDEEGASATPVPCWCEEEYAWWATETKSGEPVTWVRYDWEAAHKRRLQPGMERPTEGGEQP